MAFRHRHRAIVNRVSTEARSRKTDISVWVGGYRPFSTIRAGEATMASPALLICCVLFCKH